MMWLSELIQRELHKMSNSINNFNNSGIYYITDSIYDLLIDSAKQIGCFLATNHSNVTVKSRNNKKPWFNQSCRHKSNTLLQNETIPTFTQI